MGFRSRELVRANGGAQLTRDAIGWAGKGVTPYPPVRRNPQDSPTPQETPRGPIESSAALTSTQNRNTDGDVRTELDVVLILSQSVCSGALSTVLASMWNCCRYRRKGGERNASQAGCIQLSAVSNYRAFGETMYFLVFKSTGPGRCSWVGVCGGVLTYH